MNARLLYLFMFFLPFSLFELSAQDPTLFAEEIAPYTDEEPLVHNGDLIIFTGSSSIRMWESLEASFPGHNVINRGFGGSQMSDLLYYAEDLVIKHKPAHVFVYEGDNDIAAGEDPSAILLEVIKLREKIHEQLPETRIVLISAKPSISRWKLRGEYNEYNAMLWQYALDTDLVDFVDVWSPMLKGGRKLRKDLFIEDGLHMNQEGYDIWTTALMPYMP